MHTCDYSQRLRLVVDLEPSSINFTLDADFYLFALEGKVNAKIDITSGIAFSAHTNVVNALDMVKIQYFLYPPSNPKTCHLLKPTTAPTKTSR